MLTIGAWGGLQLRGPVRGGHRNPVWEGSLRGERVVVRQSRRDPASLDWELQLLRSLTVLGFCVPQTIPTADGELCFDGIVVQQWMDGLEPTSPEDWSLVANELARLHQAGGELTRRHGQRPGCAIVSELSRTSRSVDADLGVLPDEVATLVLEEFSNVADVPVSVIHGDPGASNIRIDAYGIVGLLDWDESRIDVVWHDLSNLGIQVLGDVEHARAQRLSHCWEALNAWKVEPEYAQRRLQQFRRTQ